MPTPPGIKASSPIKMDVVKEKATTEQGKSTPNARKTAWVRATSATMAPKEYKATAPLRPERHIKSAADRREARNGRTRKRGNRTANQRCRISSPLPAPNKKARRTSVRPTAVADTAEPDGSSANCRPTATVTRNNKRRATRSRIRSAITAGMPLDTGTPCETRNSKGFAASKERPGTKLAPATPANTAATACPQVT